MSQVVQDANRKVTESGVQLQVFLADPQWVHFAAMLVRPGVCECVETLELRHYKPGTPSNDLFHLRLIQWEGMAWGLISIPAEDRPKMERAAAAYGLRVADGVPTCIGPDGASRFPADTPRTFTLENVSGHPVYKRGARP